MQVVRRRNNLQCALYDTNVAERMKLPFIEPGLQKVCHSYMSYGLGAVLCTRCVK